MDKEMKEQEPTVIRNVVVLFSEEITERLIAVNHTIHAKIPSKVVLSEEKGSKALPHMTIYQAKYPERNIAEVKKTLQRLAKQQESFTIVFQGTSSNLGTVFFDALPNSNLTRLHQTV